jgi:UDP-N-acetylmuramoyl-tripeptide--D-alanyl-D-alanine ligase
MPGRYSLSDLPHLLNTPLGRKRFKSGVLYRMWPVLSFLARRYRRWVVPGTRVVAVVGSFGKTTTARAVTTALQRPIPPRLSANGWTNICSAVLRIRRGDSHAVIEAGIDGKGQMAQYARLVQPDITVVTSIGSEHLRSLGTLETTRDEKCEMVRALPATGLALLNGDDANVLWMRDQTVARVVTFGLDERCDYRAMDIRPRQPGGMQFRLHRRGAANSEDAQVAIQLNGQHMVYPALAAIAVACEEGLALEQVVEALAGLPPTPGRLETIELERGVTLLCDDYKSTLETVHAALDAFDQAAQGRRWIVMGEVSEPPGSQGPIYRELGERMAKIADRVVLVGNNYQRYASGARRGGMAPESLFDAGNSVREAAAILDRELQPGDIALIKGRDTQHMQRISLLLQGREVKCELTFCDARGMSCIRCPMLERGWEGKRVVI